MDGGFNIKIKSLLNAIPNVPCVSHVPTRPACPTCPTHPACPLSALQFDFINIIAPESNRWTTCIYTPPCIRFSVLQVATLTLLESVRIRSFSGPHFPAIGLNTERYSPYLSVFNPNAGKCGPEKLRIGTLFMQS